MKIKNIKDVDGFFKVIDSCAGKVELITGSPSISFYGKGQVRQPWHGLCLKRYAAAYQSRSKGSGTHHPGSNGTIAGEVGFMKNIFFEEKYLQISFFAI